MQLVELVKLMEVVELMKLVELLELEKLVDPVELVEIVELVEQMELVELGVLIRQFHKLHRVSLAVWDMEVPPFPPVPFHRVSLTV